MEYIAFAASLIVPCLVGKWYINKIISTRRVYK